MQDVVCSSKVLCRQSAFIATAGPVLARRMEDKSVCYEWHHAGCYMGTNQLRLCMRHDARVMPHKCASHVIPDLNLKKPCNYQSYTCLPRRQVWARRPLQDQPPSGAKCKPKRQTRAPCNGPVTCATGRRCSKEAHRCGKTALAGSNRHPNPSASYHAEALALDCSKHAGIRAGGNYPCSKSGAGGPYTYTKLSLDDGCSRKGTKREKGKEEKGACKMGGRATPVCAHLEGSQCRVCAGHEGQRRAMVAGAPAIEDCDVCVWGGGQL